MAVFPFFAAGAAGYTLAAKLRSCSDVIVVAFRFNDARLPVEPRGLSTTCFSCCSNSRVLWSRWLSAAMEPGSWSSPLAASSFRSAWDFFLRSRNSSEQKARAQGIQKVITSFMFVASLYFFSDIMPQLTIFCKTLQAVDISLEGVLAAYELTRATLHAYKSGIDSMPFLRRFVASVMAGGVLNLTLPTAAAVGSAGYRACVADQVSKWDKAVRAFFGAYGARAFRRLRQDGACHEGPP